MPDSVFWRFSLQFYAQPGVAEACLRLQDESGADVNVMLYLLFLALAGRELDDANVAAIESIARPWTEAVVVPLRSVRRRLKEPIGAFEACSTASLRTEVKRIELAAERLQQETLERVAPTQSLGVAASARDSTARANLAVYARRLDGMPQEAIERLLACFSQLARETRAE